MVGGGDGYLNPTISIRLNQSPYFKNLPTTQYLTIGHGLDDDGDKSHNITYGMLESHLETQVPVSPVRSSAPPKIFIRISNTASNILYINYDIINYSNK